MASDQKLKLYPSGFLGSIEVAQTKPVDVVHRARSMLQVRVGRAESHHTASEEVNECLARAMAVSGKSHVVDDVEKLLKIAKLVFGTQYFGDWVTSQLQSPEFTKNHGEFLDDTVQFIFTGRQRRMSALSWAGVLTGAAIQESPPRFTDAVRYYVFMDRNTSFGAYFKHQRVLTIEDLVAQWISQPGGVDDMLSTLVVFFGSY